jgi:hypothetical protein
MSQETVRPTEFPPPEANPAELPPLLAAAKNRCQQSRCNPCRQAFASRLTADPALPPRKTQPPFFQAFPHSCALRQNSPLVFLVTSTHWDNPYFDELTCFQLVAHTGTKTPGVGGGTFKRYLKIRLSISANPSIINTSVKSHFNPPTINTYKNTRLKVPWNQYLQKNRGGGGCECNPLPRGEVPGKGSFRAMQVKSSSQRDRQVGYQFLLSFRDGIFVEESAVLRARARRALAEYSHQETRGSPKSRTLPPIVYCRFWRRG